MAIDTSALTLGQYAILSNDPLVMRVVNSLYQMGNVIQDWPLLTRPTLKINGVRWEGSLATVGWRKINEGTTVVTSTPTPYAEQAFILSNAIDTDVKLIQDQNQIQDPRGAQLDAYLAAVTYDINDKFINNKPSSEADAWVGVRERLDNASTYGVNSACKIDASVTIDGSNFTAANVNKLMRVIDQMLDELNAPEGEGVVFYANRNLVRLWNNGIKLMGAGGGFDMGRDAFDRRVLQYRGATIRPLGPKADQSTEIITSTEASGGADGSSTYTSIYAVRYGESHCQPWQMAPLQAIDIGIRPDEPTQYRVFVDWACGLAFHNVRSMARAYNIKVA